MFWMGQTVSIQGAVCFCLISQGLVTNLNFPGMMHDGLSWAPLVLSFMCMSKSNDLNSLEGNGQSAHGCIVTSLCWTLQKGGSFHIYVTLHHPWFVNAFFMQRTLLFLNYTCIEFGKCSSLIYFRGGEFSLLKGQRDIYFHTFWSIVNCLSVFFLHLYSYYVITVMQLNDYRT